MFDVHCPTHGSRVLLGPRSIVRMEHTSDGVRLHWRCRCGTHGVLRFARDHRHRELAAAA